jgi:large subunit ribosomal protein L10
VLEHGPRCATGCDTLERENGRIKHMKDKDQKKKDLEDLKKALEENKNIFVTSYEKLRVSQDFALRKTVRDAGGSYRVVKNNLASKASEGTPANDLLGDLKGMTSLAFTSNDPVALAKALTKYAKDNAAFTFKAGMVEGRVIDVKAINDLAAMPPKEEIYAKLLYLVNASATRLVFAMNGVGRNLAVVLDQAGKENKFKQ